MTELLIFIAVLLIVFVYVFEKIKADSSRESQALDRMKKEITKSSDPDYFIVTTWIGSNGYNKYGDHIIMYGR